MGSASSWKDRLLVLSSRSFSFFLFPHAAFQDDGVLLPLRFATETAIGPGLSRTGALLQKRLCSDMSQSSLWIANMWHGEVSRGDCLFLEPSRGYQSKRLWDRIDFAHPSLAH